MPIEIRELVLRFTVNKNHSDSDKALSMREKQSLKKEIIEDCLDKMKDELEKRLDR